MSKTKNRFINNPDALIEDLIKGMIAAHPDKLKLAGKTGRAIIAVNGPRPGKVGIVVGGGSGHEPAFAGYVGKGLADASPIGNIFASPSPAHILDAAIEAQQGAGVLFLYGNYAGDVMNFDMATEALVKQGIEARSFLVTDDVASAPPERASERRGIAGDFFVFKIAGAAADQGYSLDEVEKLASLANDCTRTMGVALSPCSMPQTGKANFDIPVGKMEVGMGIHGEPGIEQTAVATADEVTEKLTAPILKELSLGKGDKVAVLVNGLGSTTLLELYILHGRLAEILSEKEIAIHYSWVGEYCTSLEMGGASITLMKLSGPLIDLLDHPCDTPALRVGEGIRQVEPLSISPRSEPVTNLEKLPDKQRGPLQTEGAITPQIFRKMLQQVAEDIFSAKDTLCDLDGIIGDGDHGITMEIGWKAVIKQLDETPEDSTVSDLCSDLASAFLNSVGASVGPLYASGFESAGNAVSDRLNLDGASLVAWIEAMADGIQRRGKATQGQKTMIDAWVPAMQAAKEALENGGDENACLNAAATAAENGAKATAQMQSSKGRSRTLGARSLGHKDPGAVSASIILRAMQKTLFSATDQQNSR